MNCKYLINFIDNALLLSHNYLNALNSSNIKEYLDKFLILNLLLIFTGFILFLIAVVCSFNQFQTPYKFFQSLWMPLFIPAISIFFTAVFIQYIFNYFLKFKDNIE